ncbi:MAG: hypothetical protein ACOX87_10970, partial [Chloroflexota bacterium]
MEIVNNLFGIINDTIAALLSGFLPDWVVEAVKAALAVVTALLFLIGVVMSQTYLDRRVIAR